jgi:hypothetical protein
LTVATLTTLCHLVGLSAVTVARSLRQAGYFTSFNHNSSFYVLADTPRFDADGLWWHGDVGFSRHRTLQATLLSLIGRAPAGCTVAELEQRLATPVGNLLSRLTTRGLIGRMTQGRCAVYLAADSHSQAQQRTRRDRMIAQASPPTAPSLPANLPSLALIELLVQLLHTPTASFASLSLTLQSRGLIINAEQIRSVFDFYDLKKRLAPWPCLGSSAS